MGVSQGGHTGDRGSLLDVLERAFLGAILGCRPGRIARRCHLPSSRAAPRNRQPGIARHTLRLLVLGLDVHGDDLSIERLYDWLAVGIVNHKTGSYTRDSNAQDQIQAWLGARPERLQAIVKEGVARCPEPDHIGYLVYELDARLFGAGMPLDSTFGGLTRPSRSLARSREWRSTCFGEWPNPSESALTSCETKP